MLHEKKKMRWQIWAGFMFALAVVLALHGAVPFFATPTLGQAVWSTGFSESFINTSLFSIYAENFGAPEPAAIAFGLAGAYPASLFIAAGLHAADAYSAMSALWLSVAFFGAWRIGMLLRLRPMLSILCAMLWMSMPIIWAHSGYSMLSLGIALLPFYFWTALLLFTHAPASLIRGALNGILFTLACVLAVFMDGYSFMMFAVGSSLLAFYLFVRCGDLRRHLVTFVLPFHVFGFALAYVLYAAYIGTSQYDPAPLDFFRGWGVDLSFLVIPTRGLHWFWDILGWSVLRSGREYFGDASVWTTTFCLPLIIAGLVGWWRTKAQNKLATGFLLLALIGFYMALGPSLKIDSTRPYELIEAGRMHPLMSDDLAFGPTGSEWLSANLPGFKNMRAAYRWSALGMLGLWGLVAMMLSRVEGRGRLLWASMLMLLILLNLPPLEKKWKCDMRHRDMFLQIDADLVSDLKSDLKQGELVAFLPYRNDFLVNYLAPRLDIRTYNVGGDKNLSEARNQWPTTMKQFRMGLVDAKFSQRVLLLLARGEADAVVLPYIDMLWAAHAWPAPLKFKDDLAEPIHKLRESGFVAVEQREYYTVVRVLPQYLDTLAAGVLEQIMGAKLCLPSWSVRSDKFYPEKVLTQVGIVEDGALLTTGTKGFLHFGPYKSLQGGEYRIVVNGTAAMVRSAWVDVVSKKGTVQHDKFSLSSATGGKPGVLLDDRIKLDVPVDDIEIRVFVGAEDDVRLAGYEVVPVQYDQVSGEKYNE